MRKNKQKKIKKIQKNTFNEQIKKVFEPDKFDPFGSYTGLTEDMERPIQDADDL